MVEHEEKRKDNIEPEYLPIEDIDVNPYELVNATSKYARQLNERMRKFYGLDTDIQPRKLAMKKVGEGNLKFVYDEDTTKTGEKTQTEGSNEHS